jgi:DNA-directed RNA polymerase subunit RPC12/RpoP
VVATEHEKKMNNFLLTKDDPESSVNCSSCGAPIREGASRTPENICLICHARILNDHFQKVRGGKSRNLGREVPPRS